MLPFELLTLFFFISTGAAVPRAQTVHEVNVTATGIPEGHHETPDVVHGENWETGFESTPSVTSNNRPTETPGLESTDGIFLTGKESLFTAAPALHTEIAVPITKLDLSNEPTLEPTLYNPYTTRTQWGGHNPTQGLDNNPPQPTSGGDALLNGIISQLGVPQPGAQPNAQPPPTAGHSFTPGAPLPANEPQVTVSPNDMITLGPSTITLTPGLSTTLGSGNTATIVSFTTDAAGHSIIVLSLSGTIISATVTHTPLPSSLPRTGFDASVTAEATQGNVGGLSSAGTAAASTSRKGAAAQRWNREAVWLLGGALVFVGATVVF